MIFKTAIYNKLQITSTLFTCNGQDGSVIKGRPTPNANPGQHRRLFDHYNQASDKPSLGSSNILGPQKLAARGAPRRTGHRPQ